MFNCIFQGFNGDVRNNEELRAHVSTTLVEGCVQGGV